MVNKLLAEKESTIIQLRELDTCVHLQDDFKDIEGDNKYALFPASRSLSSEYYILQYLARREASEWIYNLPGHSPYSIHFIKHEIHIS